MVCTRIGKHVFTTFKLTSTRKKFIYFTFPRHVNQDLMRVIGRMNIEYAIVEKEKTGEGEEEENEEDEQPAAKKVARGSELGDSSDTAPASIGNRRSSLNSVPSTAGSARTNCASPITPEPNNGYVGTRVVTQVDERRLLWKGYSLFSLPPLTPTYFLLSSQFPNLDTFPLHIYIHVYVVYFIHTNPFKYVCIF